VDGFPEERNPQRSLRSWRSLRLGVKSDDGGQIHRWVSILLQSFLRDRILHGTFLYAPQFSMIACFYRKGAKAQRREAMQNGACMKKM